MDQKNDVVFEATKIDNQNKNKSITENGYGEQESKIYKISVNGNKFLIEDIDKIRNLENIKGIQAYFAEMGIISVPMNAKIALIEAGTTLENIDLKTANNLWTNNKNSNFITGIGSLCGLIKEGRFKDCYFTLIDFDEDHALFRFTNKENFDDAIQSLKDLCKGAKIGIDYRKKGLCKIHLYIISTKPFINITSAKGKGIEIYSNKRHWAIRSPSIHVKKITDKEIEITEYKPIENFIDLDCISEEKYEQITQKILDYCSKSGIDIKEKNGIEIKEKSNEKSQKEISYEDIKTNETLDQDHIKIIGDPVIELLTPYYCNQQTHNRHSIILDLGGRCFKQKIDKRIGEYITTKLSEKIGEDDATLRERLGTLNGAYKKGGEKITQVKNLKDILSYEDLIKFKKLLKKDENNNTIIDDRKYNLDLLISTLRNLELNKDSIIDLTLILKQYGLEILIINTILEELIKDQNLLKKYQYLVQDIYDEEEEVQISGSLEKLFNDTDKFICFNYHVYILNVNFYGWVEEGKGIASTQRFKKVIEDDRTSAKFLILYCNYLFVHDEEKFLYYDKGVYVEDQNGLRLNKLTELFHPHIYKTPWHHEVTKKISRMNLYNSKDFDKDIEILNFKNGLYDVKKGELKTHDMKYLSRIQHPVIIDKDAKCPKFEATYKDIFEHDPTSFDRFLTAIANTFLRDNRFPRMTILYGPGNSGKSMSINLVKSLVGEKYTSAASLSRLIYDERFEKSKLYNMNMTVDGEMQDMKYSDTAKLKNLISDDEQDIEFKFKDGFRARLYSKLWVSGNVMPTFNDPTDATAKRILPLTFVKIFKEKKGEDEDENTKIDNKDLLVELTSEASGIMNLVLDKLYLLLTDPYSVMSTIEEQVKQLEILSNNLDMFLQEYYEFYEPIAIVEVKT